MCIYIHITYRILLKIKSVFQVKTKNKLTWWDEEKKN